MTPAPQPSPRSDDTLVNLAGLTLALVVIAFAVRIYASLPKGAERQPAQARFADGREAEQPKDDVRLAPFNAANDRFRAFYRQKRADLLARQPVTLAVSGDTVTFTTAQGRSAVRFTPPEYHVLKTHAHMALALNLALAGDVRDVSAADLQTLKDYAAAVVRLRPELERFKLTEEQKARQKEMTDLVDACLTEMAATADDAAVLQKHNPKLRELAMKNAYDASKVQIDGLKRALADFAKSHPQLDLKQARAVVSGVQPARAGNLQTQTLAKTLGLKPDSESLVYAEALFDYPGAVGLLGTRLLDTDASRRIFGDGERLWRDVLADAAAEILAKEGKE